MALEGKIRGEGRNQYVVYTTTFESEPIRRSLWWRIVESYSNRYNANRPSDGDRAESRGEGQWFTSNGNGPTGRVSTGDGRAEAERVEDVPVLPPKTGGKELRWREGRWEKLTAKGWIPAGEGQPAAPKAPRKPRAAKAAKGEKSAAELAREIEEFRK